MTTCPADKQRRGAQVGQTKPTPLQSALFTDMLLSLLANGGDAAQCGERNALRLRRRPAAPASNCSTKCLVLATNIRSSPRLNVMQYARSHREIPYRTHT